MLCPQSFYRYNSFKNPVAASDVVFAASALVEMYGVEQFFSAQEHAGRELLADEGAVAATAVTSSSAASSSSKISSVDAFFEAYSCLGRAVSDELLRKGIQTAQDLQRVSVLCADLCA